MSEPRLVADAWLSERLGKPAFHLVGALGGPATRCATVARQLGASALFADVKVAVDDMDAAARAGDLGFVLTDTNLRFAAPRSSIQAACLPAVGFADRAMADAIGAIAEHAFVHDRFHRDPRTQSCAGALKREWARNFFAGARGEWMVAACRNGAPIGFLQLLRSANDDLIIDLIAVEPSCAGQGVASAMIGFAAENCAVSGAVVVGTQVANVRSIRLYERLGFQLQSAQYVFHHHGGTA
jgi:ribosomal protein S18 acetylase RimI-like enzyme